MTMYRKTCDPDSPHRNPAMNSRCDESCYTPVVPCVHGNYAPHVDGNYQPQDDVWCDGKPEGDN